MKRLELTAQYLRLELEMLEIRKQLIENQRILNALVKPHVLKGRRVANAKAKKARYAKRKKNL